MVASISASSPDPNPARPRAAACYPACTLGEIVVRGPEVFAGYENNPEANAKAFRDGWFRSDDLGRIDSDGFLYVVGRIKDVINCGGAKVAPMDVEEALARHPQVEQAAAFALPRPTLGEDVEAAEVLRGAFDKLKRAALARIFAETLGVDRVGAFDNFFQLGGDSLRGMRAMARIHSEFAVPLGIEALFRRPTAAALAVEIREAMASGMSDGPAALPS
jgi:acyl-CoA synthetase (AMP-forming)/AMP-acid ligase II